MQKMVKSEGLEVYRPDLNTGPRVYYKNLFRYTKCFIAGSVALQDKDECAEGAKVTLSKGAKALETTETNNYGDFKFDDLGERSGKYSLTVTYRGYKTQKVGLEVKTSINVGTIFL
jgi:hypothetical protein